MELTEVLRLTDFELYRAFIAYLENRIGEEAGVDQLRAWEALPDLLKQFHAVVGLDSQVFNGGFTQYLRVYAGYSPFIASAIRGLDMVGCPAHAELAREAVAIYVHYLPNLQPLMEEFRIPPRPKVDETDITERFREAGDLQKILVAWVDANREAIRSTA
ncbi:MAG: DUF4375 domain-containing protein [Gemmataceae bacterium]